MAKKHKKKKDKVLVKLLLDDVLKYFQDAPTTMHNYKDVCAGIGATDPMDRIQVMEVLEALVANVGLLNLNLGNSATAAWEAVLWMGQFN